LGAGSFAPTNIAPLHHDGYTVGQLTREFLLAKARAGKSDRYLQALRNSLLKFARGRTATGLASVTVHDVEKWLADNQWQPRTQKGYRNDVRTMFNFAVRRGYCQRNPAAAVELPECDATCVSLHTPAEVRAVLEFARGHDVNVMRALAVRYFAGLRSAECDRIADDAIGEKYIEVSAEKSKTRRRRLVTIQPNLRAWLALGGGLPVRNTSQRWAGFSRALHKATGVTWPHNVTRHSFVSYHLAKFENAGKTALEAGHTEQMLFSNYRELVTTEAAEEFWAIYPHAVAPGVSSSCV
jgi:hypothetical protein